MVCVYKVKLILLYRSFRELTAPVRSQRFEIMGMQMDRCERCNGTGSLGEVRAALLRH